MRHTMIGLILFVGNAPGNALAQFGAPPDRAVIPQRAAGGFGGNTALLSEEDFLRRQLVELANRRAAEMSIDEVRRTIALLQQEKRTMPPAAHEILQAFHGRASVIQKEANQKINVHKQQAIADLKELQGILTRAGKLDEAVAVRDTIRALKPPPVIAQPDPGSLAGFREQVGRSFYFRITGNAAATIWGSNIYTADSRLATAAVHVGALKNGQTGIVKVTILQGQPGYAGSTRNGIRSNAYGAYGLSYRIKRVELDEDGQVVAKPPGNLGVNR